MASAGHAKGRGLEFKRDPTLDTSPYLYMRANTAGAPFFDLLDSRLFLSPGLKVGMQPLQQANQGAFYAALVDDSSASH